MLRLLLVSFFLVYVPCLRADVISSIKPIELIVKDLLVQSKGISSRVLLGTTASPHHYSLKVSDVRLIRESDLLIWVGPELETFLAKPIQNFDVNTLMLGSVEAIKRDAVAENLSAHGHHHNHADAHIWLSYRNASVIATEVAKFLAALYPSQAALIEANLSVLVGELQQEHSSTRDTFAELDNHALGVYHDGYSAYVEEFNLIQLGYAMLAPEEQLSVKKLVALRRELSGASCLIAEKSSQVRASKLADKLNLRMVTVDLMGEDALVTDAGGNFIRYMQAVTRAFTDCLSAQKSKR